MASDPKLNTFFPSVEKERTNRCPTEGLERMFDEKPLLDRAQARFESLDRWETADAQTCARKSSITMYRAEQGKSSRAAGRARQ